MSNSNLASPPPSMLHKILSKIATSHLRDFGSARIAFSEPSTCDVCMSSSSSIYLMKEGKKSVLLVGDDYVMLNLAFSVDARGFVHNYPSFSLEFVDRMNYIINPNVSHDCWCSAVIEPVFVVSLDGTRTQWTCNRCFWQYAAWDFCNDIHLTASHWPIED
ncbi:unnamed protein product [Brassica rapa subsp. trilocularis]